MDASPGGCRGSEEDEMRSEAAQKFEDLFRGGGAPAASSPSCSTSGCDRHPRAGDSRCGICAENQRLGLRVIESALIARRASAGGGENQIGDGRS